MEDKKQSKIKVFGAWLNRFKWWISGVTASILLLAAVFVPLPYYVEMPGGAFNIAQVLTVNDKEDSESGSYEFVAVSQVRATFAWLVYAWATPFTDITTVEETTGDYSQEDYIRINQFYMETSQNTAIYQALTLAGKTVSLDYQGVYVLSVSDDSTFKGVLNIADTVTGVNSQTFSSSEELIAFVSDLDLGSEVTVQYTSGGESKEATGKIIELSNGKNGIGIGLVDHTSVSSDDKITFHTGSVGGPSAGLMFTLDIYDQVSSEDLRKGRTIAGTGTINMDGTVGEIGGIDKKVVSAAKSGATIFFAPAGDNYKDAVKAAKEYGTDMKIVKVSTVQEAIDYLRNND
ncbi:SepM family pheromone-processing serine protease [Streptococcus loxodontisalivarius]|uniref:endopeptidase La n=1 Tax=Streptococcus loxodontisalivarius TaxID=1349415 RepID=A0ABS2PUQ1_9STRE|nr:SepM family pheromone-processing serine protease [Streptococcus loxodontisalivarius]MBM7643611.1 PDZ domain-containing protein [Streptococcus loxodontisalivarius]